MNHLKLLNRLILLKNVQVHRSFASSVRQVGDAPIPMENPFKKEKQVCTLCKFNIEPDYKNVRLLSQFQSPYTGRVYGRHITGLCKRKQEKLEAEIEKAIAAGYMAGYHKAPEYIRDPKLFNPEKPFRPHKY